MDRVLQGLRVCLAMCMMACCLPWSLQAQCEICDECDPCDIGFCELGDDWGFSGYVNVLALEACEPVTWGLQETMNRDDLLDGNYDWGVGFRTGGAILFPCWDWSLNAGYTFFTTDGGTGTNAASITTYLGNGVPTSATFEMDLDFHSLDIALSHECCLCDCLHWMPYGGFRGIWIYRDFREHSTGGPFVSAGDGGLLDYSYNAYGIIVGSYFQFCALDCLDFYGRFGGSLLVGCEEFQADSIQGGSVANRMVRDRDCHPTLGLDLEIGFSYEFCACDTAWRLGAGYLNTSYLNISNPVGRLMYTSSLVTGNLLTIHGFSLQAGFEY